MALNHKPRHSLNTLRPCDYLWVILHLTLLALLHPNKNVNPRSRWLGRRTIPEFVVLLKVFENVGIHNTDESVILHNIYHGGWVGRCRIWDSPNSRARHIPHMEHVLRSNRERPHTSYVGRVNMLFCSPTSTGALLLDGACIFSYNAHYFTFHCHIIWNRFHHLPPPGEIFITKQL